MLKEILTIAIVAIVVVAIYHVSVQKGWISSSLDEGYLDETI